MTEPRLIIANLGVETSHELFAAISSRLADEGLVKASFLSAAEAREATYPTGLDFGHIQVAIPHVDRALDARLSIWPLVTAPHNQVRMLGAVIDLLQEPSYCQLLLDGDEADVRSALQKVLDSIEPAD